MPIVSRSLFYFVIIFLIVNFISNTKDDFKTTTSNASTSSCPFSDSDFDSSKDPHLSCPKGKSKNKFKIYNHI